MNFNDASRVTVRAPNIDPRRLEGLNTRLETALAALGRQSSLSFSPARTPRPNMLTYSVAGGIVQQADLARLEREFRGIEQISIGGMTYIVVPMALAVDTADLHLRMRYAYVAGMVVCAVGALYFSGFLDFGLYTAATGSGPV